jgi:hypothetical protein
MSEHHSAEKDAPRLRCPKCRRTDRIRLIEVHAEIGETDPGTVLYDEGGHLIRPSGWMFEAGNTISVEAECEACGRHWRPRQQLISTWSPDEWAERTRDLLPDRGDRS